MVQRTTVGVPDKLWKKMEKWKESLNYSKIFQAAISEVIKRKEDFQKRLKEDFDMETTIERLREERADGLKEILEFGKEEGLIWAKSAHYSELQYVLNDWLSFDLPERDTEEGKNIGDYIEDRITAYRDKHRDLYNDLKIPVFITGFHNAVEDFWKEIEDKM